MSAPEQRDILTLAALFREAVQDRENVAIQSMIDSYDLIIGKLEGDLDGLLRRIAIEREAGREISRAWLMREERLQTLVNQVEREVSTIAANLEGTITRTQRDLMTLGQDHARQLMLSGLGPAPAGVAMSFNRINTGAIESMVGFLQDGSPLRELLDELGPDASSQVREALVRGIGTGQHPRTVARLARAPLDGNLARAERLARNEMLRAYRTSSQETYKANRDVVQKYIWTATLGSSRTCMSCVMMHGTEHEVDTIFGSHPACFPAGTMVSGPRVIGSSERWYSGTVMEIETALGNRFTVTPNHPILTPDGWVAAGELCEGGNVISAPLSERPLSSINPNEYQVPALIENVAKTFGGAGLMVSCGVPTSAEDFHGDGAGSNVHVIRADSELRNGCDTAGSNPRSHHPFGIRNMRLPVLASFGRFALFSKALLAPLGCLVRCLSIPSMFFRSAIFHHHPVSVVNPANRNTIGRQTGTNCVTGYTKHISKCVLGFAGNVSLNDFFLWQTKMSPTSRAAFAMPLGSLFSRELSNGNARSFGVIPHRNSTLLQFTLNRLWCYLELLCKSSKRFTTLISTDKIVHPWSIHRFAVTPAAYRNAVTDDGLLERFGINMKLSTEILESLPLGIHADRIVKVSRRMFSGHVYNLQTTHEWYNAAGVIVHNCRCAMIAKTVSWEDLGFTDIPDTRPTIEPGRDWFERQPSATQQSMLGNAKFNAWKDGQFDLSQLVHKTTDPDWGIQRAESSLRRMIGAERARQYYGGKTPDDLPLAADD